LERLQSEREIGKVLFQRGYVINSTALKSIFRGLGSKNMKIRESVNNAIL